MSINLANIINVSLNEGATLLQADNANVVGLITRNDAIGLDEDNRTMSFTDLASVGAAFGTIGAEYDFAQSFFGTKPNAVSAGGRLVYGYQGTGAGTNAFSARLVGGFINDEAALLSTLQTISDGRFSVWLNGQGQDVVGLDFTGASSMFQVTNIIEDAIEAQQPAGITNPRVSYFNSEGKIYIDTGETGSQSTTDYSTDFADPGTYIGALLNLEFGSGAVVENGTDAVPGEPEDVASALNAILAEQPCKGITFINAPADDAEVADRATYAQANDVLIYDVFSESSNLETVTGNPVWDAKLAGQDRYRMLYSKANNRKMAVSYMARMHTVNFDGDSTAITMNLKELSITPESYSQTEVDKAQTVGLDVYTTVKNGVPLVLSSGANNFTDNVYNTLAFVEDIKVGAFNALKGTSTKVAQTNQGVNYLVNELEQITRKFVNAGVFAGGTWNGSDTFGDLDVFNKNIELNGFYWKAGSLAAQSQVDREARKSPAIQGAVKFAGAIHSADIIINFNK